MSSYRGLNTPIIPSAAMTTTTTITSQVIDMNSCESVAFQPVWTGTPTGTFIIQISLDYKPSNDPTKPLNAGTWDTLAASISNNPAGSSGHTYIPIYASCGAYIRLSYTNVSGSGTLSGTVSTKTR